MVSSPTHPPVAEKVAGADFDGTIAPWGAMFSFPEPLPGAVEAINRLKAAGYTVVIFTSRLSPTWHEAEGWDHYEATLEQVKYIRDYCEKYGIVADAVTAEKIPCEVYLDDKALGVSRSTTILDAVNEFLGGPKESDRAWAAGFFDSEGTVSAFINSKGELKASVAIDQVDRRPIDKMRDVFGGTAVQHKTAHQPAWRWRLSGKRAADFLTSVLPFLIVKREQAVLYIDLMNGLLPQLGSRGLLGEGERQRRESLVSRIKELKQGT